MLAINNWVTGCCLLAFIRSMVVRANMRILIILLLLLLPAAGARGATIGEITQWVADGHWQAARQAIVRELARTNLDFQARDALLFQQDRLTRIRLDFGKTRAQVLAQVRALAPGMTEEQFDRWDKSGALESLNIDGKRWYFNSAARNLFLISPPARALAGTNIPVEELFGLDDVRSVIADFDKTGGRRHQPRTWEITYRLSVKPDMVPAGETIRAWLPLAHTDGRQQNIRVVSTDPPRFIRSDTNDALSSLYLEKPSLGHQPTEFKIIYDLTTEAFFEPIDPARVRPADASDPALVPFLGEEPPHIVFANNIRQLERQIVGAETNSYLQARRLFAWTSSHITWANAREYSTLDCLPQYALAAGHGDCGIKTMTFMTLCRCAGIPARWESGWTTEPVKDMHDWCEIYLAPYGWVPVDVTYGLTGSADEREQWFYLGGIDGKRFFVNTDYAQPLFPAKTFYRSEIVDFQRGEVEWRDGNLYFNQWKYDFDAREMR